MNYKKKYFSPNSLFSVRLLGLPVEEWRDEGDEEDESVDAEDDDQHFTEVFDQLAEPARTAAHRGGS